MRNIRQLHFEAVVMLEVALLLFIELKNHMEEALYLDLVSKVIFRRNLPCATYGGSVPLSHIWHTSISGTIFPAPMVCHLWREHCILFSHTDDFINVTNVVLVSP